MCNLFLIVKLFAALRTERNISLVNGDGKINVRNVKANWKQMHKGLKRITKVGSPSIGLLEPCRENERHLVG